MKTWKEFWKNMNEGLDNPVDIKWTDKGGELGGFFIVNDKVYSIICKDKGDRVWTFKFYKFDENTKKLSPELTGDNKNVFRVLPTIKDGFDYLIEVKNPDALVFGALDSSEGRKKLYHSFSEKMVLEYGFKYSTNQNGDKQIFILYKNIDKDLLMDKVVQITEEEI